MPLTLFHLMPLACLLIGAVKGAAVGQRWGVLGAASGVVVGAVLGGGCGWALSAGLLSSTRWRFANESTDSLRGRLIDPDFSAPNLVVVELILRGEDLSEDLPTIVDMLGASSQARRVQGWAALTAAAPELLARLPKYNPSDSTEQCRTDAAELRESL